jgi:hypothetical protein
MPTPPVALPNVDAASLVSRIQNTLAEADVFSFKCPVAISGLPVPLARGLANIRGANKIDLIIRLFLEHFQLPGVNSVVVP